MGEESFVHVSSHSSYVRITYTMHTRVSIDYWYIYRCTYDRSGAQRYPLQCNPANKGVSPIRLERRERSNAISTRVTLLSESDWIAFGLRNTREQKKAKTRADA